MDNLGSRRTIIRHLATAAVVGGMTRLAAPADGQCSSQSDHIAWVAECLERMKSIQVGMARDQLMNVFTTQGGVYSARERQFVSRDCPYFKVNVKFDRSPAGEAMLREDESKWLVERDDDVITSITGPFLGYEIFD